jgi:uncharacterized protein YdaU (DUF1376 family)
MTARRDDAGVRGRRRKSKRSGNDAASIARLAVLAEIERIRRAPDLSEVRRAAALETLRPGAPRGGAAMSAEGKVHILPQRPVRRRKGAGFLCLFSDAMLAEFASLSLAARGAYTTLLLIYWETKRALPDDDAHLAQFSGAGRQWRKIRPELERLFVVADGVWHHDHIDHEIAYFQYVSVIQARRVGIRWARERAAKAEAGGA